MSYIPYHPAPGLGELVGGWYAVPQNPIRDAGTPMVPSMLGALPGRTLYQPRIGELMPAKFTVPQNPLVNALVGDGMAGLGAGVPVRTRRRTGWPHAPGHLKHMAGLGCACKDQGMGDLSTTLLEPVESLGNLPTWLVYGGIAAALFMFIPSKGGRR